MVYYNMSLSPDPSICTLSWLRGFGEQIAAGNTSTEYYSYEPCATSFEHFVAKLEELIRQFNGQQSYGINKRAIVAAYTISKQPVAEGFLKELGFTPMPSGPFPKYTKHTCTLWSMPSPEFYVKVKKLHAEFQKAKKVTAEVSAK